MLKLVGWSLSRSIKAHWEMALFIVVSVAAALFCVNVLLGYAQTQYLTSTGINYYSTLTIVDQGEVSVLEKVRPFVEENMVEENKEFQISNCLYFTVTEENIGVLGWYGDKQTRWFPHVSGTFFTEKQMKEAQNVIYLTSAEYIELEDKQWLRMDGIDYKITGTGWINDRNFKIVISEESSQTLFVEKENENKKYSTQLEGLAYVYRVIPYTAYVDRYEPEMMFLQFDRITNRQLMMVMEQLKNEFSQLDITMPAENSDEEREEQKRIYGNYGAMLACLVWLILITVVREWISVNRRGYRVFRICGAGRLQISVMIVLELGILFLSGMIVALLSQKLFLQVLAHLDVKDMPTMAEAIITMLSLYLLTCIVSVGKIAGSFSMKQERVVD
ncbi:MAG: hypothetical protein IJZ85_04100 [Lachnospiraceae bacterium]|nr:hypothetical protein [Lachnospiraceae bacterium]